MTNQTNPTHAPIIVQRRRGRGAAVAFGVVTALGVSGASAAWIGGVTDNGIGGDSSVVVSCDQDGIVTNWVPEWSDKLGEYAATTLVVQKIDKACDGWYMRVMVQNADNKPLGEFGDLAITPDAMKIDLGSSIPASQVGQIDVTFFRSN